MKKDLHRVYYGNISMLRAYCSYCHRYALVIDEKLQCCDRVFLKNIDPDYFEVECSPEGRRFIKNKKKLLNELMENNKKRCTYCNYVIGEAYRRNGNIYFTKPHLDHKEPFIYSYNNNKSNIYLSCNLCNLFKSSKIFNSIEEVREHARKRREEKRIEMFNDLSELPKGVPEFSREENVLL